MLLRKQEWKDREMPVIYYIVKYLAYILITLIYGYYAYREGYKQAQWDNLEYLLKKNGERTEE